MKKKSNKDEKLDPVSKKNERQILQIFETFERRKINLGAGSIMQLIHICLAVPMMYIIVIKANLNLRFIENESVYCPW